MQYKQQQQKKKKKLKKKLHAQCNQLKEKREVWGKKVVGWWEREVILFEMEV